MAEPRVIYEVTIACEPSVDEDLRGWLPKHVAAMLELPGFAGARMLDVVPAGEGEWPTHTVHYSLTDRAALEEYFASHAERMRAATEQRYGDSVRIERRVLTAADAGEDTIAPPRCLNCGHVLHGQYCGICGQRSSSRLISLWGLIAEGLGDLLDMDSRLWRTLRALLLRPGYLTAEYLEGRRARFMPPFRMYLAFSLLFFLTFFFGVTEIQVELDGEADLPAQEASQQAAPQPAADPGTDGNAGTASPDEPDFTDTCDEIDFEIGGWLGQRLTEARVRDACRRVVEDRGRNLARAVIDDLPTALFAFLPVIAFVLKLLYPLSRRYYAEHLLFIVHYQSFVFLVLTLQVLLARLIDLIGRLEWIAAIGGVVVAFYIPVYLYRSMRRVYQQGFIATFTKFVVLSAAYFLAFVVMMAATFVVAALSL